MPSVPSPIAQDCFRQIIRSASSPLLTTARLRCTQGLSIKRCPPATVVAAAHAPTSW